MNSTAVISLPQEQMTRWNCTLVKPSGASWGSQTRVSRSGFSIRLMNAPSAFPRSSSWPKPPLSAPAVPEFMLQSTIAASAGGVASLRHTLSDVTPISLTQKMLFMHSTWQSRPSPWISTRAVFVEPTGNRSPLNRQNSPLNPLTATSGTDAEVA